MDTPQSLQELDLAALVGTPLEQARRSIETAGGTTRTVAPGGAVTLDFRPDRVTLVVEDDRVVRVEGIG